VSLDGPGVRDAHRGLPTEALNDYSAALKLDPTASVYLSSRGVVKSELGWYRHLAIDAIGEVKSRGFQRIMENELD